MLKKCEELVPGNVLFSQRKSCSNTQLIPLMLHLMIETFIFFKNLFGELHMSCCTVVQLVGHKLKPSSTTVAVLQSLFKTRDKVQQGNFGKAQGSFVVVWIPHERDQMRETNWAKGFMPLKEQRSDKKARLSMAFRPTCKIKQHGGKIVYPVPSYHEFWTETVRSIRQVLFTFNIIVKQHALSYWK